MQTRRELIEKEYKQYQKAGKKEKTKILDRLVKVLECNRKYFLHVLATTGKTTAVRIGGKTVKLKATGRKRLKGGGRKPIYTGEFTEVLRKIWAFFWYRCGKILAPFMREKHPLFGRALPHNARA